MYFLDREGGKAGFIAKVCNPSFQKMGNQGGGARWTCRRQPATPLGAVGVNCYQFYDEIG